MEHAGPTREYNSRTLDKLADYLLLCGNIGSVGRNDHHDGFKKWFIQRCSQHKLVFWVAGNNEFKGSTISYGVRIMREWAALPAMNGKLIVLEDERFDLVKYGINVSILGCVLWTPLQRNTTTGDVGSILHDTKERHNQRFENSFAWLKNEVQVVRREDPRRRILVMTRHAPTLVGSNQLARDNCKARNWSAYQNDILGGEGVPGLQDGDAWVFGHAHFACDFRQDKVRALSNAMGGTREATGGNLLRSGYGKFPSFEM